MITPAQKSELLRYIETADVCPSFREMMGHMQVKSKNSIWRMLNELETDGRIRRLKQRSRAIEVVSAERRQFFRFDPETKQLVQFTPVSMTVDGKAAQK